MAQSGIVRLRAIATFGTNQFCRNFSTFDGLGLSNQLVKKLERLKITKPTVIQERVYFITIYK